MCENLALPLVLAAVFTTSCILIQRLEQHAECVEDVFVPAFLIVASLATVVLLGRYADGARAFQRSPPGQVQVSEAPRSSSKTGLTGVVSYPPRFRQPCC
ncbi:hypothetical protein [Methylobacterium radiotolerans]|uniref:hypothetical protein n=1 Tax=Methylobacterium radiotolerans TaxID=31998 RepID=UPI0038CF69A9